MLAQLGNRVQHALRAFTPEDADNLRKAARTFPTTDFYDVEKTLTSLGTGEALVTVLSPKGDADPARGDPSPGPRLAGWPPSTSVIFHGLVATSPMRAKYGETVDRDSAHERITAKLATAREAAAAAASAAAVAAGVDPEAAEGFDGMTPAQQQREVARRKREADAAAKRAAAEAKRQQRAATKAAADAAKARQRSIDSAIRTGGRVVTSRVGQDLIRGIFGTLFGGGKKR